MAQMIPNQLRADTKSRAERDLYEAFQQQLPDHIVVFHSVPWQSRHEQFGARDGETDFIIADPDRGFLIVEAKSGNVHIDGPSGRWYSGPHEIDNPFEQAKNCKYSLLNLLKEQRYWSQRFVTLAHAVAIPDVIVAHNRILPSAPRDIILDKTNMRDLNTWLTQVFTYWKGQDTRSETTGAEGVRQLINLVSPTIELRPLIGQLIDEEEQELLRATEEQYYLLDLLGRERQLALLGCAGSGKTLIAAEKARRLAAQGFRVLLTCFNRNLAEFLRASIGKQENLEVKHFHGLCADLSRQAGLWRGNPQPTEEFFAKQLPEQLVDAADMLNWRVDAIIVDEGQDFRDEWWLALRYLLADPDHGIFYVFFDDHQSLYGESSVPLDNAPIVLSKNCRNTRSIHEYVSSYYRGDHTIQPLGPMGRAVETETYQNDGELKRLLRRQVYRLVNEERVHPEDIVVLTPRAANRSALSRIGMIGEYTLTEQPGDSGEIFWTNIYQFKGLESAVVILIEVPPPDDTGVQIETEQASDAQQASSRVPLTYETLMYVGASRARNHLIVLYGR